MGAVTAHDSVLSEEGTNYLQPRRNASGWKTAALAGIICNFPDSAGKLLHFNDESDTTVAVNPLELYGGGEEKPSRWS